MKRSTLKFENRGTSRRLLVGVAAVTVALSGLRLDAAESTQFSLDGTLSDQRQRVTMEGAVSFSHEIPGPYIYDPLTQTGRANRASLRWTAALPLTIPLPPMNGSFTVEAFVRPAVAEDGMFIRKARRTQDGAEFGLKLEHMRAHNQFYLRGFLTPPGKPALELFTGHYGSSAQWRGERDKDWRHVALTYDADRQRVTSYVDYFLSRTATLDETLRFDDGAWLLGDSKLEFEIDELRFTTTSLRPAQFLRATTRLLNGVRFESGQQIVPDDAGCIDVKEHFGAVGDGQTDDTAAFQRAFRALCSRVPLAYHTLLVPPGTYLISDMIQGGRFIDVKGAGPDQTILKLKDGVFTDPNHPQPILRLSSSEAAPGSYRGVNGSSISIYLQDMTFDTGFGNPGARGLEYHSNNLGRLENVRIRSGDGQGVCGLDLTHHDCGPALVKRVSISGFDYGVQSRYQEYSMTFEHLQLRGQNKAGIFNQGNILAIRGLRSENAVSAIVSEGANSMITLIDSKLERIPSVPGRPASDGSVSPVPAIRAEGGLYALRVQTPGYETAIAKRALVSQQPAEWKVTEVAGSSVAEYVGDQIVRGFGTADGGLKLPIAETPEPPAVPLAEWVNVLSFAQHKIGNDWGPVVQAAIDSGARVVYVPANTPVEFASPVHLRGKVERIVGFGGGWRWSRDTWQAKEPREQSDPQSAPPPLLIFDDPDPRRTVWIDRLSIQALQHASPGTLVLRSSSPNYYVTGTAGGKLFGEDIGGADWHFDHPQSVWVRQWNPESHAAGPCVHSRGATIWALGFKTEYESQKLLAEAGAATEILGAFIYPIGTIPAERPIFENRDSRLALVYGTSVYHSNHKIHIRDVRGTEVKELGNEEVRWAGSRSRMDLFISN